MRNVTSVSHRLVDIKMHCLEMSVQFNTKTYVNGSLQVTNVTSQNRYRELIGHVSQT